MNITQKRYAISRIKAEGESKKREIEVENGRINKDANLKAAKLLKLKPIAEIRAEAKRMTEGSCASLYGSMRTRATQVSIGVYTEESVEATAKEFAKIVSLNKNTARLIDEEVGRISDEIMIGDSETALQLIASFSKFNPLK